MCACARVRVRVCASYARCVIRLENADNTVHLVSVLNCVFIFMHTLRVSVRVRVRVCVHFVCGLNKYHLSKTLQSSN